MTWAGVQGEAAPQSDGLVPAGIDAHGTRGAVATPHALATEAGLGAMRAGGTAIDAALAAAAMLAVVYPHQCSIGGDAFALVRAPSGRVVAINGSGRAPRALDAGAVLARYERMPVAGPLSVTVPGVLAAWDAIHRLGGRLGLAHAFGPAIARAREGAAVSRSLRLALELDLGELAAAPGIAEVFFTDGMPLSEGALFHQPALAHTLETLAARGVRAFYDGEVGERFVRGMRELGSPLQSADLAEHETTIEEPLSGTYRRWRVLTTPPNSQGFVLLEVLAALEGAVPAFDPTGPEASHVARLFRLAAADRDRYLSDGEVPVASLLARDHVARLQASMRHESHEPSPSRAEPLGRDTVAICTADDAGWGVVLIQSVFHSFGARILEPATGIVVQNRGASFSLRPDAPNRLAPGRRPAHTLMPVMVQHGGRLAYLSGAMGGKAQPQIQAEILGRLLDLRHGPAEAVAAPRWVLGGLEIGSAEGVVRMEGRIGSMRERFEQDGFETQLLSDFDEEVGQAQVIEAAAGDFVAAADPRSDGAAAAW
jgi:gamma-glutamyltranspeptidase